MDVYADWPGRLPDRSWGRRTVDKAKTYLSGARTAALRDGLSVTATLRRRQIWMIGALAGSLAVAAGGSSGWRGALVLLVRRADFSRVARARAADDHPRHAIHGGPFSWPWQLQ